ncbi:cytochrome c biogenesis protein [Corynebacterium mustelae]|uniref:Cytochrome c biogenesis protein n=1 Tax=Corynebacterium mustelae TaxID=571915 RepID=A0A0G3H5V5_9CORY|nr:cytochrome c biogenesis protein CcdA [Corynebacterium mustelae]AKK07213.1 cytochrome c biogenesis protein [Corynebacterium mustelae]
MFSMILIGLIGGILTSLSPCIIPVLPLILAVSAGDKRRPYLVVAGLALSFAIITLIGSVVLNALGLPQDTVRWVGIGLLVLVGLGMIIPAIGRILQAPFDRLPKANFLQSKVQGRGGFAVGLALGAVYVPCAGPVLAAITVAAATGEIDATIIALTISFAVGAAIPLLGFALGGNQIGQRVDWFQKRGNAFRRGAGAVVIALAVALAYDAPAAIQRALPDWTGAAQQALGEKIQAGGATAGGSLEACRTLGASEAHDCGDLPKFEGLGEWINTDKPVDPHTSGKVSLVDFWAYACINCQRANEHITKLYDHYKDYGFEVIGVHAPEYAFERELANVKDAVVTQKINYPVVQDNDFVTWKNFNNRYWPARYLADHTGKLRQIHEGEGDYAETEMVIRQLLQDRDPSISLPDPIEKGVEAETREPRSPETYLGAERSKYQWNAVRGERLGEHDFGTGETPELGFYSLAGKWKVAETSITPQSQDAHIELNYQAKWVQLVLSGKGKVTVKRESGETEEFDITEDGSVDIVRKDKNEPELITVIPSEGLELYSFTFG